MTATVVPPVNFILHFHIKPHEAAMKASIGPAWKAKPLVNIFVIHSVIGRIWRGERKAASAECCLFAVIDNGLINPLVGVCMTIRISGGAHISMIHGNGIIPCE